MAIAKRFALLILTNIIVFATISIVFSLLISFGIIPPEILSSQYGMLAIFCLLFGFGGAFISLALSRFMAKKMMGVQVIDPNTSNPDLRDLVSSVHQLSRQAGLTTMPEVGIYESQEVNAFATGPSRSRSLVAVSTGLLRRLNRDGVEGVLAHEVAHIANGDMVTMTLLQGIVNAFVMFAARVAAIAINNALKGDREGGLGFFAYYIVVFVLDSIFMIIAQIAIIFPFSRYREYRADAGGARIGGRDKMISALEQLKSTVEIEDPYLKEAAPAFAAFKISSKPSGFAALLTTHPPLEKRIERLQRIPSLS